ncbi:MAG TPA: Calx-beta domain-containing protein [Methylomirabilota bacterium]|nr:Calx-beta domain-containing protein [Methylomirabilota bacterium]
MRRTLVALALLSALSAPRPAPAQPPGGLPPPASGVAVERAAGHHDVSPPLGGLRPSGVATVSPFRTKRWARLPRHVRTDAHIAVADPVVQSAPGGTSAPASSENFEGISSDEQAAATNLVVLPPDTTMAVGPSHIVQWVNLTLAVYDKTGHRLYGPVPGNTLWQGFGGPCEAQNDGDPVVVYDGLAGRFVLTQLALPNFPDGPFYQCVAVSTTGDPLGSYHRYAFVVSDAYLNDYPKLGVWPDGYYLAVNQYSCYDAIPPFGFFACDWVGQGAYALERAAMLQGQPARLVGEILPSDNLGGMLPSHLQGPTPPPAGTPNHFVQVDDDAWLSANDPYGPAVDRLQVWAFSVNWAASPATFSFTQVAVLPTEPFDSNMCGYSPNCIPQPGVDIAGSPSPPVDALADRLMWRLQYRNFGAYQTLVTNHTVDATSTDYAGVRWYELRNDGTGWQIHQQGTFAPSDGVHRWMGSIAMDGGGNLALGYSAGSRTVSPSIRYAGQQPGDPPGQMGAEATIVDGTGYQLDSSGRWGDYSTMDLDPDDCTFWYTQEYYAGFDEFYGRNWQTRIAALRFPGCGSGLSISDAVVTEGNAGTTAAVFTVTLSPPSAQTVTVQYATANGTAVAGSDYQAASGTLTFNPGETTKTITVLVNGDTLDEPDETFVVNLSGATNAGIADGQGVGLIQDDDPPPTLAIGDATVAEGNSGTTNAVFTVTLAPASGRTVTVQYATANGTAAAGSDYQAVSGTLTFNPGETTKTVAVPVTGDVTSEPDETFLVNLSNPTNATIGDGQGIGTITNDDGLPSLAINAIASSEGNSGTKAFTFTVTLTPASGLTVTVDYATLDNTATAGSDYTATSNTLTFTPGQTTKQVTVNVQGDTAPEPDETFFVRLSNPVNAVIGVDTGVGTILNDDAPPAASITVLAPNGGEVWRLNRNQTIRWSSSGISGNVMIQLSRTGPAGTWETLLASTRNDGRETWRASGPATTNAYIRVCNSTQTVCDQSNGPFTIR